MHLNGITWVLFAFVVLLAGCAPSNTCSGSRCECRTSLCSQSCAGGGCTYMCFGDECVQDCPGGNCQLQCATGARVCRVTSCTSGCIVQCNGAATCQSSCDASSGCVTMP